MPFRPAAVLRTLLAACALSWAAGAPRVCRAADAEPPPPRADARAPAPPSAPGGGGRPPNGTTSAARGPRTRDSDQDLIDHLDVIENLELLQNLDLFDTGAPGK